MPTAAVLSFTLHIPRFGYTSAENARFTADLLYFTAVTLPASLLQVTLVAEYEESRPINTYSYTCISGSIAEWPLERILLRLRRLRFLTKLV